MEQELIGRLHEQQLLKACFESNKAELVAVYGRRRIGKTFLVRKFFKDSFDFYTTGIYEGTREEQLSFFNKQLNSYSNLSFPKANNWFDAFDQLKMLLSASRKKRKVVFFDELPWLDTQKSRFLKAFELFWNSWASAQSQLMIVVCGSATTWMTEKLFGDKGGLHNRVTQSIGLAPFTLNETEQYLKSIGIEWDRLQITECYMTMGGVPYYLSKLKKGYSLSQNIDSLFFTKGAELRLEYAFLFRSLFRDSELYRKVVEVLSRKAMGMTRQELLIALKLDDGGRLTEILRNLQLCDFIRKYQGFGMKERNSLYQLTDLYTLFYLHFLSDGTEYDEHSWTNMVDNPKRQSWRGYAFEQVCLHHIAQIKASLGISGVLTNVCSWIGKADGGSGQIDLLIDRRDDVVNLCEMKFANAPFVLTKDYMLKMQTRKELFRQATKTRKALHLTMVTTYGVAPGVYSGQIQSEVTLEQLFGE
ncbi:MAG: ATP-binding protein [Bacteroidaceae bacterium]|nr:ATP-binding protein [Bacteroidaceae bacterium]